MKFGKSSVDQASVKELISIVRAESEPGTTKRGDLSHVVFLDQNFMRKKNILGKTPRF